MDSEEEDEIQIIYDNGKWRAMDDEIFYSAKARDTARERCEEREETGKNMKAAEKLILQYGTCTLTQNQLDEGYGGYLTGRD